ncbi:hypothetical protein ACP70R_014631 [Stipagrostis hirtigluma subsp. patula]
MDAFLTAFLGDLASRSISFIIDKYLKNAEPTKEERLDSLQRLLLRVRVVVEEAGERHITNQAMLQQLSTLRKEMYRAYYTLDTYRCQAHEDDGHDQQVSRTFALSRFNTAKRILFSGDGASKSQGINELNKVLWSLETAISDANECILFLSSCPRLCRQPYNMHLILEKCMFGRQMELQHVVSFLLQTGRHGDEGPSVLPIIGPRRVGKSTLIEHACNDERVRDHFSQIIFYARNDIADGSVASLRDGCVIKHRNYDAKGERILIIVELDGDRFSDGLDEDIVEVLWQRLYSTYKSCIPHNSKIIVTSRLDKIASFGTTPPLRLQLFSQEAYWYMFKVLTFGSMDVSDHPKLASIAMDMAMVLNGFFLPAYIFSGLLRSNFNIQFWSMVLATLREFKQRNHMVTAPQVDSFPFEVNATIHIPTVSEYIVIHDDYQISSASACGEAEAPKTMAVDVMFGRARPRGKFDVLVWKSQLPPHYSYVLSCEIQRPKRVAARKKRIAKIGS